MLYVGVVFLMLAQLSAACLQGHPLGGRGSGASGGSIEILSAVCLSLFVLMGVMFTRKYERKRERRRQRRFGLFSFFTSWWRKRPHQQGYLRQDNTQEESVMSEVPSYIPPPTQPSILRHYQSNDDSSFQGSLESIDSLVESYWDPDDGSLLMVVPDEPPEAVMRQHIDFLQRDLRNKTTRK